MTAEQGDGSPALGTRDAWAVDGFAPLPGDSVLLPGDQREIVETVYLCAEPAGLSVTRWSWIVLEGGRLLEIAPRGCALYEEPELLRRGSGRFMELVAQDGALVRFEERVRAGTWQARPVWLTVGGRRWRITSTGTVTAQRLGPAPSSAWSQLQVGRPGGALAPVASALGGGPGGTLPVPIRPEVTDAEQDVYFTLDGQTDALGLGIWMTDVCLSFGRRLGATPSTSGLQLESGADRRP